MRWLQWSTHDLGKGLGGVEVHARSLSRELSRIGIESALSSDPRDLERDDWDVVHTHGSSAISFRPRGKAVRVHTLHGTTLGRMVACGEMLWPGGYAAWAREIRGILEGDVVLAVRPGLSLLAFARSIGKTAEVCWNGWDSGDSTEALPPSVVDVLDSEPSVWLFVGRGDDRMKAADRVRRALARLPGTRLIAAPGAGFENVPEVVRTGVLSSSQIRALMSRAAGLVIPSRYEGHSLAILEALANGLSVVTTPVGGVPYLVEVEGLRIVNRGLPDEIAEAIRTAGSATPAERVARAATNRRILPRWADVAKIALGAVERAKRV